MWPMLYQSCRAKSTQERTAILKNWQGLWKTGTYQLTGKKYDIGSLTILTVLPGEAIFTLNVVGSMDNCGTPDAINHIADIEYGLIKTRGENGLYDSEGGHCVLKFARNKTGIFIIQEKECWHFGQGMGISGKYEFNVEHNTSTSDMH